MGLSLQPTRRMSGKIATLIAVFALIAQPMYGLVASHVANAVTGVDLYVNQTSGNNSNDCMTAETACKDIQAAIDKSVAGNTISVAAGTYNESIELRHKLTLQGNGATIDGQGDRYTVFINRTAASGSAISGFTLQGGTNAVLKVGTAQNLSALNISGNIFNPGATHLINAGNLSISTFSANTLNVAANTRAAFFEGTSNNNTFATNIFTGPTNMLALGITGTGNAFTSNNLSGLVSSNEKVFEVKGSGNSESGTIYNGATNSTITVNPGTNYRGIYLNLPKAVDVAQPGDTVSLNTSSSLNSRLVIDKRITLRGDLTHVGGVGITAGTNWVSPAQNPQTLIDINGTGASGTVFEKLYIQSQGKNTHGVQVTSAQNVQFNNVTFLNNDRSGLNLYGTAEATVTNVTTTGNGWHGINVGNAGVHSAKLTVNGTSNHSSDVGAAILIDDHTKGNFIFGNTDQYEYMNIAMVGYPNARAYYLKNSLPQPTGLKTVDTGTNEDVTNGYVTKPTRVKNSWNAVPGAKYNYKFVAPSGDVFEQNNTSNTSYEGRVNWTNQTNPDGVYTFSVQTVGSNDSWVSSSFTVDTKAPTVTGATLNGKDAEVAPRDGNTGLTEFNTVGGKFTLGVTTQDETDTTSVRYRVAKVNSNGGTQTGIYRSGWFAMTKTSTDADETNWIGSEFDFTQELGKNGQPLADGTYTIQVETRDSLGNTATSQYVDLAIDTTAPTISWQVQPNTLYGTGQGFHVRPITSEVGTTKSIYIGSVAPENLVQTLTSDHKNFDTTNAHNQTLWDGLSDGQYKFIAVFTDYAGNSSVESESREFTIDRTAPEIKEINISHVNEFGTSLDTFSGKVKATIKMTDAAGVDLSGTWIRLGVAGGPNTENVRLSATGNPDEYTAIIDTNAINFAKNSYISKVFAYIRTIDTLGNKGGIYSYKMNIPGQNNFYINIDNVKPTLSASLSDDLGLSVEANGTSSDISKVQYRILDADKNNIKSIGWVDVPVVGEGPFVIDIDTSTLADDTNYVVRVRAFDEAGNKGHASDIELAYNIATPPIDEGADEEAARQAEQDRLARERQAERDRIAAAAAQAELDRLARERAEERVLPITPLATAFGNTALLPGDTVIDDATVETEDTDDGEVAAAVTDGDENGEVKAAEDVKDSWSLINLLLTIAVAAASIFALIGLAGKKEDRNIGARLLTVVPALGAGAVLLFAEDFSGQMSWVNIWTLLVGALLVVQMIILANTKSQAE